MPLETLRALCVSMDFGICCVMDIEVDRISVKATTEEKLGFTGREEGVAAYAVVLLYKERGKSMGI